MTTEHEHWSLGKVAIALGIVMQSAALVWGAANLNAAVHTMEKTLNKVQTTMDKLTDRVNEAELNTKINDARLHSLEIYEEKGR